MKGQIERRIELIRRIAGGDTRYQNIYNNFLEAEQAFLELLPVLSDEQQDILWDFVNLSNEVDLRLLEIACEYLDF